MLAILVLAQVASATPAATPAAALGLASTSVSAKPKTLADVARERKLGQKGVAGGTLSVSGASGMPDVPSSSDARAARAGSRERNSRVKNAEADVQAARRELSQAREAAARSER